MEPAPSSVADRVHAPRYSAPLAGADRVGSASREGRTVQIGLWLLDGRVIRARYRATTCASLIAFAEVACGLLEGGLAPTELDPPCLRARLTGVHPLHQDRADLVAEAARAAAPAKGSSR